MRKKKTKKYTKTYLFMVPHFQGRTKIESVRAKCRGEHTDLRKK